MKSYLKLCAVTLLASASLASVQAAGTNLVQALNFKLTAWSQGTTTTNGTTVAIKAVSQSIVTKDVVNWLALATTNNFTNGQLLVINQFNAPSSKSSIVVRTKILNTTNQVDVSDFFANIAYAATVNNYSYSLTNNKVGAGKYYGYWGFYLLADEHYPSLPVNFQVMGFGVDSVETVTSGSSTTTGTRSRTGTTTTSTGAVLGLADQFSMTNCAGTGEVNGKPFIVVGNVTITGKTMEKTP